MVAYWLCRWRTVERRVDDTHRRRCNVTGAAALAGGCGSGSGACGDRSGRGGVTCLTTAFSWMSCATVHACAASPMDTFSGGGHRSARLGIVSPHCSPLVLADLSVGIIRLCVGANTCSLWRRLGERTRPLTKHTYEIWKLLFIGRRCSICENSLPEDNSTGDKGRHEKRALKIAMNGSKHRPIYMTTYIAFSLRVDARGAITFPDRSCERQIKYQRDKRTGV